MLKITKLADYGVQLLAQMAKRDCAMRHSAKTLSEQCDLPLSTVGKTLKLLKQSGLLESHQGSKGGYALAKPPGRISVLEIIETFEPAPMPTDCRKGEKCRRNGSFCSSWRQLNDSIEHLLRNLTLADMAPDKFEMDGRQKTKG